MSVQHFDIVIVGAGLSGVGAAVHLGVECPEKTFVLLEARDRIGGTWDLFRYPGVRSDSDMFTLGYSFKPWTGPKSIVSGSSILDYIRDTARERGVERHVRFRHRVSRVSWSSEEALWTVEVERDTAREPARFTCNFLMMCAGYYSYAAGYTPPFPGVEHYRGAVVHPHNWTDGVAYQDKRVVVVGSGATAVTLVPEIAKEASHVIMLQRSPTYIVAWPDEDAIANGLRRRLPAKIAYVLTRWKNVLRTLYFYRLAKRKPEYMKKRIFEGVRAALGPSPDTLKHFTPRYNPWDQRLCLSPNGDFFRSIRQGGTSIVTDEIETFTETGLKLKSGTVLAADLVITATGLELQALGGAEVTIDGRRIEPGSLISYKGAMYADVPNFVSVFGYTNASWTLKADLIALYTCRLINYMDKRGYRRCMPRNGDPAMARAPLNDFTSGYFARAQATLPKQGTRKPWRVYQNYVKDIIAFRFNSLEDGVMEFARGATRPASSKIRA